MDVAATGLRKCPSLLRFRRADLGQDLLEYGLLAALIAIVAVTAVTTAGQQINSVLWQAIANNF